jgi:hypothetical protein
MAKTWQSRERHCWSHCCPACLLQLSHPTIPDQHLQDTEMLFSLWETASWVIKIPKRGSIATNKVIHLQTLTWLSVAMNIATLVFLCNNAIVHIPVHAANTTYHTEALLFHTWDQAPWECPLQYLNSLQLDLLTTHNPHAPDSSHASNCVQQISTRQPACLSEFKASALLFLVPSADSTFHFNCYKWEFRNAKHILEIGHNIKSSWQAHS